MRLAALKKQCQEKIALLSVGLSDAELDYYNVLQLRKNVNMYSNPHATKKYQELLYISSQIQDYKRTIDIINRRVVQNVDLYVTTESEVVSSEMTDGLVSTKEVTENVTDITGDREIHADAYETVYSNQAQRNLLTLDKFFERPIQIAAGKLLNGTYASITLPVWDQYTTNPTVRAKLRNYAYFKANLHLRIVVSGTPYHYGKLMLSYQPYPNRNDNLVDLEVQFALSVNFRPNMISYLSQAPGAQTLDIRENKPVEMMCPFISTKNTHRLFNTSPTVISDVTSFEDLSEAGALYMWSINASSVINATTDPARYYIYAWATDVELGAPTGTQVDIRTESGITTEKYCTEIWSVSTEGDERDTGPVEKFSSTAKRISSALTVVPEIGVFAKASSIAFGALESVASIFGWSKPVLIDTPVFVKNAGYQNGALTIGTDTNFRIVLDPKQELTVDPRICGTCEDEMTFSYLASIPAYLTTFEWIPDDVPMTPLFTSAVNPTLSSGAAYNNYYYTQLSPMAFVASFFESWRGDIEFTFEVVCSQFHRGKLAVIYEPNINQEVLINAALDLNRQYVKIIDIQETQTVTFKVNWAAYRSWLGVPDRSSVSTQQYTGTPTVTSFGDNDASNGFITVVPITDLISPDNGTVEVNVYVKCPNIMLNGFTSRGFARERDTVVLVESAIDTNFYSTQQVSLMDLNECDDDVTTISSEHYGELPVSFRSLLKRYTTYDAVGNVVLASGPARVIRITVPIYPEIGLPYGTSSGSQNRRGLLGEIQYAYLGMRGSLRHQIAISGSSKLATQYPFVASMYPVETTSAKSTVATNYATGSGYTFLEADLEGTALYVLDSNGGYEVEWPYFSQNKFTFAFNENGVGSNPGGNENMQTRWRRRVYYGIITEPHTTDSSVFANINIASGEDFTLMRFQGAPHFRSVGTIV